MDGIASSTLDELTDIQDGLPWYTHSTSGLFLDELEGIVPIKAVDASTDCEDEMATFYYRSIKTASQTLGNDILINLATRFKSAKKAYKGKIGGTSFSGTTTISKTYAGVRYRTLPMKGGVWKIDKVYAMMNADATFDIEIYKIEYGATVYELVQTLTGIQSLANKVKENVLPAQVVIELSEIGADFYFVYQPSGFQPRTNSLSCGCGSKETPLLQYMSKSGVSGNDLDYLPQFSVSSVGNGIALEGEIGCDTSSIVCSSFETDSNMAIAMATAVQYKAAELVHEYVLKQADISRYTMVNREYLWGKRNHFKSEYNDRINWLVANADMNLIDCYTCAPGKVVKRGLLV